MSEQAASGGDFDVLIVGAGISGIGSAWHLQEQCPGKTYAIIEAKDTFGGTWETHKYPGVRSDSDLYTFGYRFKPWVGAPIASGKAILDYMGEVIEEGGIDRHIRYGHTITSAKWDSRTNRWRLEARTKDGAVVTFTAGFLWMCQGYYDHQVPYIPNDWQGVADFKGQFVHAQLWDPETDVAGKRVLVIGSGATAATVVPALCDQGAKVTMLQRSPTWFYCAPNVSELAERLRTIGIDEPTIHRVVRQDYMYNFYEMDRRSREEPEAMAEDLRALIRGYVGEDFQFEPHFAPRYRVWQQRLAQLPDGDLFKHVVAGNASVVTDTIDRFTEKGVLTSSGELIEADIIMACTGFRLKVLGDIPFEVDGQAVNWVETVTYRGMMFTGVPNMAWVFGYFRASWTLRVDMMADFICHLLNHMDARGAKKVEAAFRDEDAGIEVLPWIEEDNFNPGYLMRDMDKLPRRGSNDVWRHNQNYWLEREAFPAIDLDGQEFVYDGVRRAAPLAEAAE
ncbi:flavin-containing monooxygenase [Novosphingobium taihuense]|uniref:Cation diffusion facilitator CzcD-associated flavoprotein CzcO n=1 Tax=Novosphingobium taihuense TaxID=260085 RepID=A0A7W7AB09_9SPHN|nr:NAD(P)/FAD-dependent oxidoreductase [Novosphingobium taihuense]MBB4613704.1 cation diffusion facilitator CzcD-associated flavoprotein CzcO [Novosphingobium taihuense]TWH83213.1 cation diffusion facilitator CzcD-associated flavoprotein CzcO [Novosphingobium taihuense]